MDYRINFIADLESLLNETMTADEFKEKYILGVNPIDIEDKTNGEIPDLTGVLGHYVTDGDIRKRDDSYNKMQKNALAQLIKLIKEKAPREEILKVVM